MLIVPPIKQKKIGTNGNIRISKRNDSYLNKVSGEIYGQIASRDFCGAAPNIMRFLTEVSDREKDATSPNKKKLFKNTQRFLTNIGNLLGEYSSDEHNLLIVTSFLRNKLASKSRRKKIKLSSISTYFIQLRNAFLFASDKKMRFGELAMEDLIQFSLDSHSSIRTFRELLGGMQVIAIDLEDPALRPKKTRKIYRYPKTDFHNAKYATLTHVEKVVVTLAYDLMMRGSEIIKLKHSDFIPYPIPAVITIGKGSKKRSIPISHSKDSIELLGNISNAIAIKHVLSKKKGQPYTRSAVSKILLRALNKLGLPPTNPHFLRHLRICFLSEEADLHLPLKTISEIAGHAHEKTTIEEYIHTQLRSILAIVEEKRVFINLFGEDSRRLSVREAAGILGCNIRNVQHLANMEIIRGYKCHGKWQFDESIVLRHKLKKLFRNTE